MHRLTYAAIAIVLVGCRTPSGPTAITAGVNGTGKTDAFSLSGSYAVTWTLKPSTGASCQLEAELYRASDGALVTPLVPASEATSGHAMDTEALPRTEYYIEGISQCEWRITLTPREPR